MKNLRIGARLALGFSAVLALLVLMTIIGVWRLQDIGGRTAEMIARDLVKERLAVDWASNIESNGIRTVAMIKSTVGKDRDYFKQQIDETKVDTSEIQKKLEEMVKSPEGLRYLKAVLEQRKIYNDLRDSIFKQKLAGNEEEVSKAIDAQLLPAIKEYTDRVNALATYQRSLINRNADIVDSQYQSGRDILIGVGIAALMLGAFLAWRLAVGITAPLKEAVRVTSSVASGNLATQVEVGRKDEIGQLMYGLRGMTENLLNTVREVRNGTDTIATATSEIASGNLDLSSRTEQQAGSLEETASALEELTATVQQNAANAKEANGLAASAANIASEGGSIVYQVVDTMRAINTSSGRIVDIISVIDGIAFQTNILALNAAVEAARAGEQGRGFAVVASEVRNLAQRSSTAAKEIKELIDDSVAKVASGSVLVEKAGQTMTEIVSSVRRVSDIVAEISSASHEQSTGISEVNRAITQMDQVTQQNAALVEQAAAAADALQEQAQKLTQAVSVFSLDDKHVVTIEDGKPSSRSSAISHELPRLPA